MSAALTASPARRLLAVVALAVMALLMTAGSAVAHECTSGHLKPDTGGCTIAGHTSSSACTTAGGTWTTPVNGTCFGTDQVVNTVTDQGFEHLPTVLTIFAAILAFGFAVGLTAIGTRKALAKLRMLVRSA